MLREFLREQPRHSGREPPRTYLKLNALLGSANSRILHGASLKMTIREEMDDSELRKLLTTNAVQYLRDESR